MKFIIRKIKSMPLLSSKLQKDSSRLEENSSTSKILPHFRILSPAEVEHEANHLEELVELMFKESMFWWLWLSLLI